MACSSCANARKAARQGKFIKAAGYAAAAVYEKATGANNKPSTNKTNSAPKPTRQKYKSAPNRKR